ncbi:hypothetical protein [Pyxidicoccus caerfyrddinensis]|uniref:hypothetical protein n=1 Tax=Pyxidicoccus caerfyrddinensis TaxID=2709663 RepID=UPI0013DBE987|nr:hypothetical protein [Pyxidicoccus caerfyrddinensis]
MRAHGPLYALRQHGGQRRSRGELQGGLAEERLIALLDGLAEWEGAHLPEPVLHGVQLAGEAGERESVVAQVERPG